MLSSRGSQAALDQTKPHSQAGVPHEWEELMGASWAHARGTKTAFKVSWVPLQATVGPAPTPHREGVNIY